MPRYRYSADGSYPNINHSYQRTATLWEGRFKANAIQEESYLLACYRYIELNPLRAAMVDTPKIIAGPVTAPTPLASPIRCSLPMDSTWALVNSRPIARTPIAAYSCPTRIPQCSARCAPVYRLEHRSATNASAHRSNGHLASKSATALAAGQRNP